MQPAEAAAQRLQRHEQYAKADPNNGLLQLQLGDLYHQAGRFDDALHCFERCIGLEPANGRARSRMAGVMISQHRFAEAEKILAGLVAGGESAPALLHNLGLALYYQERWEEARKYFAAAADAGLDAPNNFAYLARSLHQLGEMPEAIAICERWVELAPSSASKSYLALLHLDEGSMDAARSLGLEVLAQDPGNAEANTAIGFVSMEDQESGRARQCFTVALEKDAENGRAWLGMGLVHLYEQELPQAIQALENAARIFPDNAGIAVTLGWAHMTAMDGPAAEHAFENALQVDRTFAESHAGHAAALALQGKVEPAQEALRRAKRLDPSSIGVELANTFLLAAQGRQQQATDVFSGMLGRTPREGVPPLIEQLRIYTMKKGR